MHKEASRVISTGTRISPTKGLTPPRSPVKIERMATNIEGRKPSVPAGKHFLLEFWAWRPIHALIVKLCPDLFDSKTLEAMATGGGGGPPDQKTCTEMANRFERWMEHHADGFMLAT